MRYADYIVSEQWQDVKRRYRSSRLPQCCLACGQPAVDLHHRTYKRLGRERLNDLVPLCREHHDACHQFLKRRKMRHWGGTKQFLKQIHKRNLKGEKRMAPDERTSRATALSRRVREHDRGATTAGMATTGRGRSQARALA